MYRVMLVGLVLQVGATTTVWAQADKGSTWRRYRGQMVFAEKAFETPDTEKAFGKMVRTAKRNKTLALNDKGRWNFNFIAFLRQAPKASKVNLVWYRFKGRKKEQVDYIELVVPPDGYTLRANAMLSNAQFNKGDKLEGRITRIIGKREKVFAKCQLTLK